MRRIAVLTTVASSHVSCEMPANSDRSCFLLEASWGNANKLSSTMEGGRVRSPDRAVSNTGRPSPSAVVFAKTLNSCSTPARNASCLLPSSAASIQRRMPLNSFPRDTTWPNSLLCRKMPLTTCPTSNSSALTSGITATNVWVASILCCFNAAARTSFSGACFGSRTAFSIAFFGSLFVSILSVSHKLLSAAFAAHSLDASRSTRGLPTK
mmetsp:Transcript_56965/g.184524  ORF Transcript_56965/g.184524 Transcript_56965/m.184524 type:complete len:210 (-) Transcript_56965:528-1157(-)